MAQQTVFEAAVEKEVVRALEEEEKKIDAKLDFYDNLDESSLQRIREKRIEEYKRAAANRNKYLNAGHLKYTEIFDQTEFFKAAKDSPALVVHFYRPSAWRCAIIDKHLQILAERHIAIRFVKINAEKAEFLAERLSIWCIPTVVLVKNGKTDHSIVGFDELGGEEFKTERLEEILQKYQLLPE